MPTAYSIADFLEKTPKEPYDEIFMHIFEGAPSVTVSAEELTKVFANPNLKRLYLAGMHIPNFPNIGACSQLKTLSLEKIKGLRQLPEGLETLPNLGDLHLKDLDLGELPDSLCEARTLEYLTFERVKLNRLPENLGNLPFTTLIFREMELPQIPESFSKCNTLQRLYIQKTQIEEIPAPFLSLTSINYADLDNNKLKKLPQELVNWKNLNCLIVGNNQLKALPDFWDKLPNMYRLECGSNQITELPPSIASLKQLANLYISNNPLKKFPEAVLFLDSLHNMLTDSQQKQLFLRPFIHNYNFRDWYDALRKTGSEPAYRISLYHIFGEHSARIQALPLTHLLEALRLKHAPSTLVALRELKRRAVESLAQKPLGKGAEVYMLGDCAFKKNELKTKLQEKGLLYTPKLKPSTTHILVGKNIDSWAGIDTEKVVFLTDAQMQEFLNQDADLYLKPAPNPSVAPAETQEMVKNVHHLLESIDPSTIHLGLQILQQGGVPETAFLVLLMIAKNTNLDAKIRKQAQQFVELNAPEAIKKGLSVRGVLFSSLVFSNEEVVCDTVLKLAEVTGLSKTGIASYVYRHSKGLCKTLLLKELPEKAERAALVADILSKNPDYVFEARYFKNPNEVYEYPLIQQLQIHYRDLIHFPTELLKFHQLKYLSLVGNMLYEFPDTLQQLTKLSFLDLSYTKTEKFPAVFAQMPNLMGIKIKGSALAKKKNLETVPWDIYELKLDILERK